MSVLTMPREDLDADKASAISMLEMAINAGWSLSSVYFDGREGQYKAGMRRMIHLGATPGKRARQMFEHINAYGDTLTRALTEICRRALMEDDEE